MLERDKTRMQRERIEVGFIAMFCGNIKGKIIQRHPIRKGIIQIQGYNEKPQLDKLSALGNASVNVSILRDNCK